MALRLRIRVILGYVTLFCSTDELLAGSSFCSIPVRLTTPEAGCSDSFMGPPLANYVSHKQHKQAGTKQADGNMPCLAAVVMVLLWMVLVGISFCMLCKYDMHLDRLCVRLWRVTGMLTHQHLLKVLCRKMCIENNAH